MTHLYDIKNVAQILSISTWSVRSLVRQGRLRPVRILRRLLFDEHEIERLISETTTRIKHHER